MKQEIRFLKAAVCNNERRYPWFFKGFSNFWSLLVLNRCWEMFIRPAYSLFVNKPNGLFDLLKVQGWVGRKNVRFCYKDVLFYYSAHGYFRERLRCLFPIYQLFRRVMAPDEIPRLVAVNVIFPFFLVDWIIARPIPFQHFLLLLFKEVVSAW